MMMVRNILVYKFYYNNVHICIPLFNSSFPTGAGEISIVRGIL